MCTAGDSGSTSVTMTRPPDGASARLKARTRGTRRDAAVTRTLIDIALPRPGRVKVLGQKRLMKRQRTTDDRSNELVPVRGRQTVARPQHRDVFGFDDVTRFERARRAQAASA